MNKKLGFTLLEVIISLVILISATTIFSNLHLRIVSKLLRGREEIERIYLIQKDSNNIVLNIPKKKKPIITNIEKPNLKITSQIQEINKKSKLNEFRDFIDIVVSVGEWKSGVEAADLKIVSFVIKPPEKQLK